MGDEMAMAAHARMLDAEADRDRLCTALRRLYDSLPRWSCKSMAPDGCPICEARAALKACEG